jgi:hypothetical protein
MFVTLAFLTIWFITVMGARADRQRRHDHLMRAAAVDVAVHPSVGELVPRMASHLDNVKKWEQG